MTTQPCSQTSEPVQTLQAYVAIFHRRRTLVILIGGMLLSLSLGIAFLWPSVYKSTATILIEEQDIPSEFVRSTVTSYADQRIETIKQQVMSRTTLWKLVEQYNLYPDLRRTNPTEVVVEKFTNDIAVEVINANVVDKRTQQLTKATIAFTVAYQSQSPVLAQKVANELTSLFLSENLKGRERQAQETTSFLQQEAEDLSTHISEVDEKIAKFKNRASGALPELMSLNLQLMSQADRELMDIDQQIRTIEERKNFLEGELATIKPNTPIMSVTGERILDSSERLRALHAEYVGTSANLAPDHPDILKMKHEIEALESETGQRPEIEEVSKQLIDARITLAATSERLGQEHPDVVQAQRKIAGLEREISRISAVPYKSPLQRPENPAYINLQALHNSAATSLDALRATRVAVKQRLQDYAARLERTPEMEPDYLFLTRDRDTSGQKYQEIRSRLLEARVSEGLEIQRKGERFSLIDPPRLPEKPDKPNRLAILLLGLVLAVGGGIGSAAAAEFLDHSIRTPDQLAQLTQLLTLAVVPFMPNEEDLSRAVKRNRLIKGTGLGMILTLLVVIHFFWFPVDVLWFAALRRME